MAISRKSPMHKKRVGKKSKSPKRGKKSASKRSPRKSRRSAKSKSKKKSFFSWF